MSDILFLLSEALRPLPNLIGHVTFQKHQSIAQQPKAISGMGLEATASSKAIRRPARFLTDCSFPADLSI
jgi:hypothetical protein